MKKYLNFQLITFVALSSVVIVLISCKKSKDTSSSTAPTANTLTSLVSQTWAILNGSVNANNYSTTITFEYDLTTSYGNIIDAKPDTASGNSYAYVNAYLTGLKINTLYHYRIKAVSSRGTAYGNDLTFTTLDTGSVGIIFNPNLTYGSVSDNNGNTYKTIKIGTQTWMAENLQTMKYNDGTEIPLVTDQVPWVTLSTPGYTWYNASYGALYNWYAVNTGKLCPVGWHVPSDAEWTILTTWLGGESVAGNKLRETGTNHWLTPNTGATNESGYTALPGGYRSYNGVLSNIKRYGYWWSSTESSSTDAYCRDMYFDFSNVDRNSSIKGSGISVRCLRNY